MFRRRRGSIEVFLVHPGGPFFQDRDAGCWSVPKGLFEEGEAAVETALREFEEETGQSPETCGCGGELIELGWVVQKGGKRVHAWAFEGNWPEGAVLQSNTFPLEWPPRSGSYRDTPEVDRAEFFSLEEASRKINPAQNALVERLVEHLASQSCS